MLHFFELGTDPDICGSFKNPGKNPKKRKKKQE